MMTAVSIIALLFLMRGVASFHLVNPSLVPFHPAVIRSHTVLKLTPLYGGLSVANARKPLKHKTVFMKSDTNTPVVIPMTDIKIDLDATIQGVTRGVDMAGQKVKKWSTQNWLILGEIFVIIAGKYLYYATISYWCYYYLPID
jgi:hypothetical protein